MVRATASMLVVAISMTLPLLHIV